MIRKLRVMQALPVIDESVGIGEVRFGMRPSQVKELMGEAMTWGPTADSRLEQIAVRSTFKAKWRGIELSQLTRAVVEELMNGGAQSRDLANRGESTCRAAVQRFLCAIRCADRIVHRYLE